MRLGLKIRLKQDAGGKTRFILLGSHSPSVKYFGSVVLHLIFFFFFMHITGSDIDIKEVEVNQILLISTKESSDLHCPCC